RPGRGGRARASGWPRGRGRAARPRDRRPDPRQPPSPGPPAGGRAGPARRAGGRARPGPPPLPRPPLPAPRRPPPAGPVCRRMPAMRLAFNVLQAAGARVSKTDYVACPSCGRTLFDLQDTTARIKARTDHLVGVKIAIMGCVVNGPGEMADADFGYVGGAPGQV